MMDMAAELGFDLTPTTPKDAPIETILFTVVYEIKNDGTIVMETRHLPEVCGFLQGIAYSRM
jgi:hypothetical protein